MSDDQVIKEKPSVESEGMQQSNASQKSLSKKSLERVDVLDLTMAENAAASGGQEPPEGGYRLYKARFAGIAGLVSGRPTSTMKLSLRSPSSS